MRYPFIDMHCDTLLHAYGYEEDDLYDRPGAMQGLRKMHDAGQMLQFYAAFFPPIGGKGVPDERGIEARAITDDDAFFAEMHRILHTQVEKHSEIAAFADSAEEIEENFQRGRSSVYLSMEDGRMIRGEMDRLSYVSRMGVKAIALTWNFDNCFGHPNSKDPIKMALPLTSFGREAIAEMNRLGILVDVSHLNDGGFRDVAMLSKKPFIASHSNCRATTSHPRNLTDDMIRAIADSGGVAGLNFYDAFVVPDGEKTGFSTATDLVRHVLHMMNAGGEDVIALGTDFDGFSPAGEIRDVTEMEKLFDALSMAGLTDKQIEKFAYQNVLRVIREVIG